MYNRRRPFNHALINLDRKLDKWTCNWSILWLIVYEWTCQSSNVWMILYEWFYMNEKANQAIYA
jgi:hypothetical protein